MAVLRCELDPGAGGLFVFAAGVVDVVADEELDGAEVIERGLVMLSAEDDVEEVVVVMPIIVTVVAGAIFKSQYKW
jgi:hypothetical protein